MPKKFKHETSFTHDGKRYKIRADSLEDLYVKKANKIRDLEEGKVILSGSMTVADWMEQCIDLYKPNISDDTKKDMLYRLNKHVLNEIGMYRIKDVTPIMCQRIMSNQADMSKSHITKLYQEMNFIFKRAVKNHYILENPADDLVLPKGSERKRRSITDEERKHFLKISDEDDRFLLFLLCLYCGCRPGEAIGCIGDDIQLINQTPMLHIRGTKTVNSDRFVPIPDVLYDRIKRTEKDSPIAPNETGRMHGTESYNRLRNRLRREMNISMGCKVYRNALVEPLPLDPNFVPYFFRHTYCTDLQKAGVDIRVAQRLMGHASIEITANIYTHVDMNDIINVVSQINDNQRKITENL